MLPLSSSDIRLGAAPTSRDEAIRLAASLLAESGSVEPAYVDSMLARERVSTTLLGNGVAIPHGLPGDAGKIRATRVAVLQVPDGVEWHDGKRARLVFAIAAGSDEHIGLLTRLTGLIEDEALVDRLARTRDAGDILRALETDGGEARHADEPYSGPEVAATFENPRGFHLRPATQFAQAAREYDCDVWLVANGRRADAKSAMGILKLGVSAGDVVRVRAEGRQAAAALSRLADELEDIQNEPDEAPPDGGAPGAGLAWRPRDEHELAAVAGTLAAPGLAYGPVFHWPAERPAAAGRGPARGAGEELAALRRAIGDARGRLRHLAEDPDRHINQVQRALFNAHAELLADPDIVADAEARVAAGAPAADAWDATIGSRAAAIEALADEHLAKRAADLRDIGRQVHRALLGVEEDPLAGVSEPVILVGDDLDPSQAAQLRPDRVLGICLAAGSPNAHSAIVSRSLGIPMLVAMGAAVSAVPAGTPAILDAGGGRLLLDPGGDDVASVRAALAALEARRELAWDARFAPALLKDGHRVEVAANIGKVADAALAVEAGAEGVGLLRTEFLYLDRSGPPSEDEQYDAIRQMLEALQGLPMIVRTMDIGGDKPVDYLGLTPNDLSFLGLRGYRLGVAKPELARAQLRAVFRAAAHGPLRLMFPMISTPDDFVQARDVAEEVRREVGAAPVETGVMIEVPSAVTMARELAGLADFFSIGTNDLTQYAMAVDRTHPLLAGRADSLHPVVLRMIDETVRAAHEAGKWVGVCGGLAADVRGAMILVGLGVDELSMPAAVVPQIKAALRTTDLRALRALARRALRLRDARSVHALALPGGGQSA